MGRGAAPICVRVMSEAGPALGGGEPTLERQDSGSPRCHRDLFSPPSPTRATVCPGSLTDASCRAKETAMALTHAELMKKLFSNPRFRPAGKSGHACVIPGANPQNLRDRKHPDPSPLPKNSDRPAVAWASQIRLAFQKLRMCHAVMAGAVAARGPTMSTERQTTNLGVRSSNLFGRANQINNLMEIGQSPEEAGVNGGVNIRRLQRRSPLGRELPTEPADVYDRHGYAEETGGSWRQWSDTY